MSTYKENIRPINELYFFVSEWIDEQTYHTSFQKIFNEYESKWRSNLKGNHWKDSTARKILQVFERIKLTDSLYSCIDLEFFKQYLYPRLIIYLRLTCFDQLGQPDSWRDFSGWLDKNQNPERDSIIKSIETEDKLEFTKHLFGQYQYIYGARNSFKNFIYKILPEPARIELLNQIKIEKLEREKGYKTFKDASDSEKVDYLYSIRNDYTHNAFSSGTIIDRETLSGEDKEWEFRERIFKKNGKEHWISTRINFSEKIKQTVYIGIAEVLKRVV